MSEAVLNVLKPKDFESSQDPRWCPGCGDYAILAQMKKVLAQAGARRENTVFVSGIGCSSRFPYYLCTYGFHSIHGRAPAIATGLKNANRDLQVWVITGDGDGLSIGGNHLLHAMRRNIDLNIVLFNNRIYGLTKGQYSPTSRIGHKTKSSPLGSIDRPLSALSIALATETTFVARTVDVNIKHMGAVFERAMQHRGTAFVEVYQNCVVFNNSEFAYSTDKSRKDDNTVYLEHGKPLIYGKDHDRGIRLSKAGEPEIVTLGNGVSESDLLVHDERAKEPGTAFMLSRMFHDAGFPEPMGVFRSVEAPIYEQQIDQQVEEAIARNGEGDLQSLFHSGETWTVEQ